MLRKLWIRMRVRTKRDAGLFLILQLGCLLRTDAATSLIEKAGRLGRLRFCD